MNYAEIIKGIDATINGLNLRCSCYPYVDGSTCFSV